MIPVMTGAATREVVEMGHLRAPRTAHFDHFAQFAGM